MDLYRKVERLIKDHMIKHQSEVRKGKELLSKLDVARCNEPSQDYSYDLTATNDNDQPYAENQFIGMIMTEMILIDPTHS